mmetsp:Transcript_41166/g.128309  ORF Transcript_41166/g.128309 Transcript_41166/m.128309 type:complete len:480 (-) Transcript_41166:67-1506(-)
MGGRAALRRDPGRGRLTLAAAVATAAARPALAAGAAWAPPDFGRRSGYVNLSAAMARAGACGEVAAAGASVEDAVVRRLACALGCRVHEEVLEEALEPWWDHRLQPEALQEACRSVGSHFSQGYIGAIVGGRVFYKCCSRGHGGCDGGSGGLDEDGGFSDLQLILTLVAEVAEEAGLPDMYFLFNTGDQPFTDKVYWNPIPQLHWVRGAGHWTIPIPNPFQLKAHAQGLLGDGTGHAARHVPWKDKVPKVFWRGTLAAPDNLVFSDIETMPRVRLMLIAKQHPELFDVGITDVDTDLSGRYSKSQMKSLRRRLPETKAVDMASTLPRFRYILNVAAVLCSWRLSEMLASGSLLLLQDDSTSELIYEWLTPWEHFVPVSASLADLVPKVRWLEEHPERAEAIARQGFLQFQLRVRRQDTLCYVWQAMRSIAHLTEPSKLPTSAELIGTGWQSLDARSLARSVPSYVPLADLLSARQRTDL